MLDKIEIEHKAYLIGLFQGDGNLYQGTRNRGKLQYSISIKDKDIIEKIKLIFRDLVYVGGYESIKDTNFKKNYHYITLFICDKGFRDSLNKYIPYGKKSETIKPPKFILDKKDLMCHYIRGLVDADGSLGLTAEGKCFWSLCTQSEEIKEFILSHIKETLDFEKRLNRNKRDDVYNIVLYNEDAVNYTELLYGKSYIHIDRKYNSYLAVQKWIRTVPKQSGRQKTWLGYEDKIVLSEELTIEEKMKLLNRTKSSINTRKWRLLK